MYCKKKLNKDGKNAVHHEYFRSNGEKSEYEKSYFRNLNE